MLGVTLKRVCKTAAAWALPFLLGTVMASAQQKPAAEEPSIDMQWAVKIPARDGVKLNATVFTPHDQKGPLPVIFTFTPYIGDSYTDRAVYFAKHGYVYALVDVRGRGNSGGEFEPFVNEGKDGYDVVEWLAKQPYCNGKVTMWGGSYAGFDQWTVLKEFPPHLATIVPAAAAHPGVDFPFQYNIFGPYDMQWLTFTSGATGNSSLFGNSGFWAAKSREMYMAHSAFQDYDKLVGNPSAVFQKWVKHPTADAYYDAMVPSPEQYKRMNVPILTITGDYDGDQPGASAAMDSWAYDPLDTRPGSAESEDDGNSLTSQRAVLNLFGEGVVYHTEPFREAIEIAGFPKLTVWLKMDVPDTDLEADLYEILPDGGSVALTSASMRARYRESLREAKPVAAGKIEKYVFDNFTFFGRRIAKGSRLRLVVRSINSTGSEKNYNSGGVVAAETGKDAKTAHITLLHDAEHPGVLELPVVK